MEYKQKIKNYLKEKGKANLKELKELYKKTEANQVTYNIRRLLAENEIRPHIEIDPKIPVKPIGIADKEIFFSLINRYEAPQDILKLIEDMQSKDIPFALQAQNEFINLCMNRGSEKWHSKMMELYKDIKDVEDKNTEPHISYDLESIAKSVKPAKIESVNNLSIQLMSKRLAGYEGHLAYLLTVPPSHIQLHPSHIQQRLQFLNNFV